MKLKLIAMLLLSMLAGCASVPMASDAADEAAKKFAVRPGFANIYVYRNQSFGASVAMTVAIDGVVVGRTAADTYVVVEVRPGTHTVSSIAEDETSLRLAAGSGQNYFVHQQPKMGWFRARSELRLVDEAEAKDDLNECKRVERDSLRRS